MSDTPVLLGPSEVDSIVLGAAENEGRRLGFTLSPSAKDLLLQRSLPALNRENEEGRRSAESFPTFIRFARHSESNGHFILE